MAHTEIISPTSPELLVQVALIFREYAQSLSIDLGFQGFEQELALLPGDYAAPRGALLLATVDGVIAGCCALRPLDASDYANASEMNDCINAAKGFDIDISSLGIPLDFIWSDNRTTHKTLNCVSFTL